MQLEIGNLHPWVKNVAEARTIQEQLRQKVIVSDCLGEVKYVAGVDVGYLIQEINNKQQQQRSIFFLLCNYYLLQKLYYIA